MDLVIPVNASDSAAIQQERQRRVRARN